MTNKMNEDTQSGNHNNELKSTVNHNNEILSSKQIHSTEPMAFLQDLDKDISRKFAQSNRMQEAAPDSEELPSGNATNEQPINNNTNNNHLEKIRIANANELDAENVQIMAPSKNDNDNNAEKKNSKLSNAPAQTHIPRINNSSPSTSPQSSRANKSTSRVRKTSQSSPSPSASPSTVSTSKIPKPVRSRQSNVGVQQATPPAGKYLAHSCRSNLPTQQKRQRQLSVGAASTSKNDTLKDTKSSQSDKRTDVIDSDSSRSKMKPTHSSPIRNYEGVNVILPAKTGAGETGIEHDVNENVVESHENTINYESSVDKTMLESRSEYLMWLSRAISEKRLNICKLDECFSNYKSTFSKELTCEAAGEVEGSLEVFQKLIRRVSDLFEQSQLQKSEFSKLQASSEVTRISDLKKIELLESQNTDLVNNMEKLSKCLDEEKVNNMKLKNGSQHILSLKKRIREYEQKLKKWEDKHRELAIKAKNVESGCKMKNLEAMERRISEIKSMYDDLFEDNSNLRNELQNRAEQQNLNLSKMVDDSKEMKATRQELTELRAKYKDEVARGKKYSVESQQTSLKLEETEKKCKEMNQLIEKAKREIKAKADEFEVFKQNVEEEKKMIQTELQACKVTKQGTMDENDILKAKLEAFMTKTSKVSSLERERDELESQLRTELMLRDEQIMQLQERIKELIDDKCKEGSVRSSGGCKQRQALIEQCQIQPHERASLTAQILDLQRNVDELANNNLELQKLLSDRNVELDQRDQIVRLQTDVLKIRDELIELLKNKDSKHEKDVEELSCMLLEREHAIEKVWKTLADKSKDAPKQLQQHNALEKKKMLGCIEDCNTPLKDVYLSFEEREVQLDGIQHRIRALEVEQEKHQKQRVRQEHRMKILEQSLLEKDSCSWIPVLAK